jgi:hypothetical protein
LDRSKFEANLNLFDILLIQFKTESGSTVLLGPRVGIASRSPCTQSLPIGPRSHPVPPVSHSRPTHARPSPLSPAPSRCQPDPACQRPGATRRCPDTREPQLGHCRLCRAAWAVPAGGSQAPPPRALHALVVSPLTPAFATAPPCPPCEPFSAQHYAASLNCFSIVLNFRNCFKLSKFIETCRSVQKLQNKFCMNPLKPLSTVDFTKLTFML